MTNRKRACRLLPPFATSSKRRRQRGRLAEAERFIPSKKPVSELGSTEKPLYRKVVTIVSPDKALTNKTYPFDASVDTMVSLHGVLQSQKSVSTSKYPLPFFYEENVYLSVWYSEGALYARAGSGAVEYLNQPVTVCLEYTKATDEGGAT